MKKSLLFSVVLVLGLSMLMASPGVWESTETDGVDTVGDSATMNVSFNLSGIGDGSDKNESVKIGFSKVAVKSLEDDVQGQETAVLTNQEGYGKLSEDRFIFWQISSAKEMEVSLSWPASMTGSSSSSNKLGWTITTSLPSNGATDGDVIEDSDNSAIEDGTNSAIVLNRSSEGDGFKYGTVGSQQLTIVTDPLDSAEIDNYTAILTLSVKTK